jgi:hypothetical protein
VELRYEKVLQLIWSVLVPLQASKCKVLYLIITGDVRAINAINYFTECSGDIFMLNKFIVPLVPLQAAKCEVFYLNITGEVRAINVKYFT